MTNDVGEGEREVRERESKGRREKEKGKRGREAEVEGEREEERKSHIFSYRALVPPVRAPPPGPNFFPKAPLPNSITPGVGLQHMNFGGTHTHPVHCSCLELLFTIEPHVATEPLKCGSSKLWWDLLQV